MKKQVENIKKQYKREGARFLYVVLGFVTGKAFASGMDWLATKFPEQEGWFKYSKAPLLGVTGFLLSSASDEKSEFVKHFGYGVTGSAAFEGLKITPIAQDYLMGIGDSIEKRYYREDEKPAIAIGDFGISSLPIRSVEMGEIQPIEVELPELEGALGYNKSATRDTDNLGYNKSATLDTEDVRGII